MKGKLMLMAAAAAVGYVAGTRAGRERYDEIRTRLADIGVRLPDAKPSTPTDAIPDDHMSSGSMTGMSSPERIDLRRTDAAMSEVREDTLAMSEKVQSNLHGAPDPRSDTSTTEPRPTV